MKWQLIALCLLLVMIGCRPIPQVDCFGFTGGEPIVSANHCLDGPYTRDTGNSIIQDIPDGWQIANLLQNADGVRDKFTDYAEITKRDPGLQFILYNSVDAVNGQWGYSQDIKLDPGCYLLKVAGHNNTNDPPHAYNFAVEGYFDEARISQQVLPAQDGYELIYPFQVEIAGTYPVRWMVQALWGSAGEGSRINVLGAGVLEVDPDFCNRT